MQLQPAVLPNLLALPLYMERVVGLGFAICLDCCLFFLVSMPLRVLKTTVQLLVNVFAARLPLKSVSEETDHEPSLKQSIPRRIMVNPVLKSATSKTRYLHECLLLAIVIFVTWMILPLSVPALYHYVRGQSVLKLYVVFNMLQVSSLSDYPKPHILQHRCLRGFSVRSVKMYFNHCMILAQICDSFSVDEFQRERHR